MRLRGLDGEADDPDDGSSGVGKRRHPRLEQPASEA
jgi:hypothetical protein